MVGWHHQLNGHDFEQALGDGEGQGSLACCSSWDWKESDTIMDQQQKDCYYLFFNMIEVKIQNKNKYSWWFSLYDASFYLLNDFPFLHLKDNDELISVEISSFSVLPMTIPIQRYNIVYKIIIKIYGKMVTIMILIVIYFLQWSKFIIWLCFQSLLSISF